MATSVRLAPDVEQRLDHLASVTGRTKAYYLREIIERGIEDMEDIYLSDKVLENIRAGRETTSSLDDVEKRLGLAD
jgi:RHH-type rel operon transcriptional repressor/antitoxin RelB